MARLLLILLLVLPAGYSPSSSGRERTFHDVDSEHWTDEYDSYFKKYSKRYFGPNFDWRWFKAQAIAESGLKPDAKSWVGAKGLMQIMPATYKEIRSQNQYFRDISEPRWNIAAGIFYDRYLYREWDGIPEEARLLMSFASYNAGLGGIRRAKRRSPHDPVMYWRQIQKYAPKETRGYVARIRELKLGKNEPNVSPRLKGISGQL